MTSSRSGLRLLRPDDGCFASGCGSCAKARRSLGIRKGETQMRKIEQIETLIIGGGQAGLAMSDMLSRRGLRHCILERNRIAQRWRSERWDGLRFQFPNWSVR